MRRQMAEAMAKAKESGRTVTWERTSTTSQDFKTMTDGVSVGWAMATASHTATPAGKKMAGESLGTQIIEGVNAAAMWQFGGGCVCVCVLGSACC